MVFQSLSIFILIHVVPSTIGFDSVKAAAIEKPAGELPLHKPVNNTAKQKAGSSKSKVVQVRRDLDVAINDKITSKAKVSATAKANKTLVKPVANNVTDGKPKTDAKHQAAKNLLENSEATASEVVDTADKWDSASKRFEANDPAKDVSRGVRVEDIIEPTVDYRYSNARRKNPFIPEIVLAAYVARQRELSPNDVEIPIVSPLQAFSVSQLTVIGVWETDNRIMKALIGTPATQGIEAKLGDPVGSSGGRIMSITPESVVVREFSLRTDGTREYRDIPLHMGSDLPKEQDSKVGGRLILRPGSTQPEIISPEAPKNSEADYLINNSGALVPGGEPGTLKTVEQVMIPEAGNDLKFREQERDQNIRRNDKNANVRGPMDEGAQMQQIAPEAGGLK